MNTTVGERRRAGGDVDPVVQGAGQAVLVVAPTWVLRVEGQIAQVGKEAVAGDRTDQRNGVQ
jgi:hypothetical protein